MVTITALSPAVGVHVNGITADDLLDDAIVGRCLEALRWRGVLVIRGLLLDDEGQLAFSRRLGTLLATGGDDIFTVSLDPSRSASAECLDVTFNWHIDGITDPYPAEATMLTARHVANVGGRTEFASTYVAYETLPEDEREGCEHLRVVHRVEAAQRLNNARSARQDIAAWRTATTREISLVWKRRDGRCSLAIGATADHIVDMPADESRALLDELLSWATQQRWCYTHEWEVGDVVVWDNTGMLHRSFPYEASSERVLRRTTIAGDEAWS
jgi:alpha-ketoglutarate-dependent taurine dioxygenase